MDHSNVCLASLVDATQPFAPPQTVGLPDAELLDLQRDLAEIARRVSASAAAVAAEIAHRSRPDLGYEGLAQRVGARTPQRLVQRLTGGSSREAATLVRIGSLIPLGGATIEGGGPGSATDEAQPSPAEPVSLDDSATGRDAAAPAMPWLSEVGVAVAAGRLGLDAADAIRGGLGQPDAAIEAEQLGRAASRLLDVAATLTVEQLAAEARAERAQLDSAGVAEREAALRERRYLHLFPQPDGMTRIAGLLDPESASLVSSAVDAATSPRRGGPRFVDSESIARARALRDDARTTEQLSLDALVELVRLGGAVEPGPLLGTRKPAVQLLVAAPELERADAAAHGAGPAGTARIEGQTEPVSAATAQRHICDAGTVAVSFDQHGQVVDVGREQRLFTRRQRIALAARDGGCRFPGCERPPSWTEAHHIVPWQEGGGTDLDNGILLCRHHHLLVHNNGWAITRRGAGYAVVPPRSIDPEQHPIPAPSRSRALATLLAR